MQQSMERPAPGPSDEPLILESYDGSTTLARIYDDEAALSRGLEAFVDDAFQTFQQGSIEPGFGVNVRCDDTKCAARVGLTLRFFLMDRLLEIDEDEECGLLVELLDKRKP